MAIPLESLLGRFGTSIGQGLTGGLHQLAENKMQSVARQRQENAIKSLPPELQGIWNLIPQKNQGEILSGLAQGGFFDQQQDQKQMEQPQSSELEKSLGEQQPQNKQVPSALDLLNMLNESRAGGLNRAAQQSQTQEQSLTPQQQLAIEPNPDKNPISNALSKSLGAKQKVAQAREERESKKVEQKEQHHIDKETKPYFDQVLSAEKAAHDTDRRAGRLDKIVKEGGLPIAFFYDLFKKLENASVSEGAKSGAALGGGAGALLGITGGPVGAGAGALAGGTAGAGIGAGIGAVAGTLGSVFRALQKQTSPSLEEFEKLSSDFIKGAKAIFGARITDKDLEYFFNTIPTLSQTDSGKKKILRNIKTLTEASHLEYKTMKDIIKENNGKRPENLALLVNERMQPELDKLSQKFISGD